MKNPIRTFAAGFAALVLFTQPGFANAAEIKILSAAGFRFILEDLGPKFERASGHKLAVSYGTLGVAVKQLQGGETADLVILPREGIDTLVKDGKAAAGNATALARVGLNMAVRKGAPKPDIASPEALKRTLLAAKSITYGDPAAGNASGIQFVKVLDRLGITKEMKSKTVLVANTSQMAPLFASGKAEIAVTQLGNLLTVDGIDIVGPLPKDLQQPIVFTGVVMNSARDAGSAKALISFLRSAESAKVIKAKGMDPA